MDSLFDLIEPQAWDEVPAARFFSWSLAEQLTYCERRDLNSAMSAEERGEPAVFYEQRTQMYRGMINERAT